VRDVAHEAPLRLDERLQPSRHGVEVAAEVADLVAAAAHGWHDAGGEVAAGEPPHRAAQRGHRRREVAGEPEAEHAGGEGEDGEREAEGARLEEVHQAWRPARRRDDDPRRAVRRRHRPAEEVVRAGALGALLAGGGDGAGERGELARRRRPVRRVPAG